MTVNLKTLDTRTGPVKLDFSGQLDLSAAKLWGEAIFPEPVEIQGTVKLQAGILSLTYTASVTLHAACARCLAPVADPKVHSFAHVVVENVSDEQSEDQFVLAPGSQLDMAELALADLLLELDGQILCSPDCEGLCPICGGNRNQNHCDCAQVSHDPPFGTQRLNL